jgi:DNA-binding CsgD family transcriptional regulator
MNEVDAQELDEFAWRVLVDRGAATQAVATSVSGARSTGLEQVVALAAACRDLPDSVAVAEAALSKGRSLAATVAAELAQANAALTRRQREILALRELLGLSYDEISEVMGLDSEAVCAMLARARLQLRAKLRGFELGEDGCPDRDQALQVLARGLDREPVPEEDVNWLLQHIAGCESCQRAHSEMHEASVVYRAWVWR